MASDGSDEKEDAIKPEDVIDDDILSLHRCKDDLTDAWMNACEDYASKQQADISFAAAQKLLRRELSMDDRKSKDAFLDELVDGGKEKKEVDTLRERVAELEEELKRLQGGGEGEGGREGGI